MTAKYKTRDKIKRKIQMMERNCDQMEKHLYEIDLTLMENNIDNSEKSSVMFGLIEEVRKAIQKYRETTIG